MELIQKASRKNHYYSTIGIHALLVYIYSSSLIAKWSIKEFDWRTSMVARVIRKHQKAPISKCIWRLGEWLHRNWRTMVVSRNSCNHIVIKHSMFYWKSLAETFSIKKSGGSSKREWKSEHYKSRCLLSFLSSLFSINCVFEAW